jgi:chemotaxis methyl-accepting protein methylase
MLRGNSEEITALFNDLLIGVTHIFRDSEAFGALESWSYRGFRMAGN